METKTVSLENLSIGDVYLMDFSGVENEQRGVRPGLIIQNNKGNSHSPNVIAVPLTSSLKNLNQDTHVLIKASDTGIKLDSIVLCENPQRMSKSRMIKYITTLSDDYMEKIAAATLLSSSIISFINKENILNLWEKARKLNE